MEADTYLAVCLLSMGSRLCKAHAIDRNRVQCNRKLDPTSERARSNNNTREQQQTSALMPWEFPLEYSLIPEDLALVY
jgi:hypothetical protein